MVVDEQVDQHTGNEVGEANLQTQILPNWRFCQIFSHTAIWGTLLGGVHPFACAALCLLPDKYWVG